MAEYDIEGVETNEEEPETTVNADSESDGSDAEINVETEALVRPHHIPEKFWNSDSGEIRTESLLKSYQELERRFGSKLESPDDYVIESHDPIVEVDPAVNAVLHKAGFSNEQAQTVYTLASDVLKPMAENLASEIAAQRDIDWLANQHGGEEKWRTIAPQIKSWAADKFPNDVYENLASTREGVSALYRMMSSEEPSIGERSAATPGIVSEDGLKAMMRDPRYWRDQDPGYIAQVREGFQRLYPD